MKRIAILASGAGSNARNIIEYFRNSNLAEVALVAGNRAEAGVFQIARDNEIPAVVFDKMDFLMSPKFLVELQMRKIDLVVLAGFLWKVPSHIIAAFPSRIINIHPALLPKYGGKGMYGHHVHEAVLSNKETVTGITIHFVNEHYDEGAIIFQAEARLAPEDDVHAIEQKVRSLEMKHYPEIIERVLRSI